MLDGSRVMAAGQPAVALDDPRVRVVENLWIPMPDGVRLAARLFLPADADSRPTGVVIEYLPYRKRDGYRYRDDIAGPALAASGIGLLRVDIRGSGDSEGVILDEYLPPEQDDALEVIAWTARQAWCNGHVGMRGISYGSFSGLQAAAKAPPALRAIVSACGTEQRYLDDIHYRGGCLLAAQLDWGMEWQVILRGPPDPRVVGPRWRALWGQRLAAVMPIAIVWGAHQRLDATWRYGSITDYSRLNCAMFHVAGQLDSYVNAASRMMERAPHCPQKALIGPWTHKWPGYPDPPGHHGTPAFVANGVPGPGVDWLPLEARFWRRWLLGEQNGVMDGPVLWAFREDAPPAATFPQDTPGAWIASPSWPPPDQAWRRLVLNDGTLDASAAPPTERRHVANQAIGFATPATYSSGDPATCWREQSGDDALSLTFDSAPLGADFDLLGQPVFRLRVRSDRPVTKLFVRLNMVHPDGTSDPVSNAVLNLTHRADDAAPTPLEPGRAYDVVLRGLFACHRFAAGSRIRIAISEAWWPVTWPSPERVTLTLVTGASSVELPAAPAGVTTSPPFETLVGRYAGFASPAPFRDRLHGVTVSGPAGQRLFVLEAGSRQEDVTDVPATGEVLGSSFWIRRTVREDDPNSAEMRTRYTNSYLIAGQKMTLAAEVRLRSTASHFLYDERFLATHDGAIVCDRHWTRRAARDFV
ncbi:CocE/NonD family hydrolase [Gluconacetobacter tumulicola]|uniref:CocE/NonD family hydrolase n=1 Tax=Gluconacetobacter tumulicola TaxID=1017177 RepID=A0A7W4JG37_9PROT|nr:CocE/NonD family hydrolase [Gluconacetobacter tumulicola]MBB2180625.1 CocE/NonD family hydrolase [Gluconacetobacter tumulicola]